MPEDGPEAALLDAENSTAENSGEFRRTFRTKLDANRSMWCCSPAGLVLTKKFSAEFIGTFILVFGSAGSAILNEASDGKVSYVGAAAAGGMSVMLIIFSVGHISGAHVNPAVTIAFATFKHFAWIQVPLYISAQLAGSVVASYVLKLIFASYTGAGVTLPAGGVFQSLLMEFILTFILMFVVTAVSTDTRAVGELAGIAVGVTVMVDNLLGGAVSGASMNPARSLGPAIATLDFSSLWVYIIGPILGALAGATAYTFTKLPVID